MNQIPWLGAVIGYCPGLDVEIHIGLDFGFRPTPHLGLKMKSILRLDLEPDVGLVQGLYSL